MSSIIFFLQTSYDFKKNPYNLREIVFFFKIMFFLKIHDFCVEKQLKLLKIC